MPRALALLLASLAVAESETRGYLFVTNRLDEVLVAAAQLKRVDDAANVTLVADAATLGELASRDSVAGAANRRLFDLTIASEALLPGTATADSMGASSTLDARRGRLSK